MADLWLYEYVTQVLAPHFVLLSAEGIISTSLAGRPGTDVPWNLRSEVWPLILKYVKQVPEGLDGCSVWAGSALAFVLAIMVRKGLQL